MALDIVDEYMVSNDDEKIRYIGFLYCLYKGIFDEYIPEKEAIASYLQDPIFYKIVEMNKKLFPKSWKEN